MQFQKENYLKYDFLARVSWAYYVDGMTQDSIAEKYNITRIKVQRMLKEAADIKMATISISNPYCNMLNCEKELINKYNLVDAVVVPADPQNLKSDLAVAAAMYIERKWLSNIKMLGVGGGKTLSYLPNAFNSITRKENSDDPAVVSLIGILAPDATMSSMDNAQQVAQTIGSSFYGIWSPGLAQTEEEVKVFLNQKSINDSLVLANSADIKVVSIGTIEDNYNGPILGEKRINDLDYWELKEKNVVGELLAYFFDDKGNIVDHSITKRSIVIDIPIKRGKVIAVSGGDHKIKAIKGALKGKLIDVLVTDHDTCKALLEE